MIAVIGGGITGLAVGKELVGRGSDVLVLEASARAGGVIRSTEVEGRVLDFGPQRTRMTTDLAQLVNSLDIGGEVVHAPTDLDLFVFRGQALRRVPFSLAELMGSDIVGVGARLRMLLEPFTAAADPCESVADYFRRKVGDDLYESLLGPLFGGLYGSDPAEMEVGRALLDTLHRLGVRRSLLFAMLRRAPLRGGKTVTANACSFRQGMQTLPKAMARSLGDRFRPLSPVRRVARSGAGWNIWLEDVESPLEAEQVVLTTPADTSAALVSSVAPALSRALASLNYNSLALVHLDAETDLRGVGFQMTLSEHGSLLRGVTFSHSLFGVSRRNLYTAFLGGSRHPEVARMTSGALADAAVAAFRDTTGFGSRPLRVEHTRMPAWDTSWKALDGISSPPGMHLVGNWRSRPGLPGRFTEARQVAAAVCGSDRTTTATGTRHV